mmetsp:Transcript_2555/g.4284  ORF Transcript_2555/g.4284 Transcript_2555/m.4284 type:complete len:83 (+) Transcript_2555:133-381(+)
MDEAIDYHLNKYKAARQGKPITNEIEKKEKEEEAKAANRQYYPFKLSDDDSGQKYLDNWECFNKKECPKKNEIVEDKRKYLS